MKIGLLGHGVVGSGVRKIIDRHETEETKQFEVVKILVKSESEMTDERTTLSILDIVEDPSIDLVCECMGGLEPAHTFVKQALENGKHVVTSNKKMLATFAKELFAIALEHHVTVKYEASCGGGIPWMHEIDHAQRIDTISSFEGIFNGTTNYILSRMTNENAAFDAMLKDAQGYGYAEQDPSDDIDGKDVCYKVSLSSLKAFHVMCNPTDIPTYGIRHIQKEDMEYAKKNGYICKLIGSGKQEDSTISALVRPYFLKKESVLANIPSNFNALSYDATTLGKATFIGQGAGSLPTAHAVIQDCIDVLGSQKDMVVPQDGIVSLARYKGVFYIRTKKIALFNQSLVAQRIGNDAILTKEVSFMDVDVAMKSLHDDTVFMAEVDHD